MFSEFEVFDPEERSIIIRDLKRLWKMDDSQDEQPWVYPI